MTERIDFAAITRGYAEKDPDSPAIIMPQRRVSYGELVDAVERCCVWLGDRGVAAGEVVSIAIDDEIDNIAVSLALLWRGAAHVNLAPHETADNLRAIVAKTGAGKAVVGPARKVDSSLAVLELPQPISGASRPDADAATSSFAADDDALYRTTSGSTGIAKVFGLTAARLIGAAGRQQSDQGLARVLRTATMQYDSTRIFRLTTFISGMTAMILDTLTPDAISALCHEHGVTEIDLGPQKLDALVRQRWPRRLPSTTRILVGGARVPGPLREAVRSISDNLWVTYATSEIGPVSLAPPDQHDRYPEGVGDPIEGVVVRLVDDDGNEVERGEVGQALIAKPHAPRRYLGGDNPADGFENGWFRPQDLLSHPAGGPLVFHGRADDAMMLNGIKVFPGAIEDTLTALPGIAEAVAYPVRSRVHGDIPVAAVVFGAGVEDRDPRRLVAYCRQRLGLLGPRRIFVLDEIPRTNTGKPLRRALPD